MKAKGWWGGFTNLVKHLRMVRCKHCKSFECDGFCEEAEEAQ